MIVGKIIGGSVGEKLIIRLKNNSKTHVGDLLIVEDDNLRFYIKVVDKKISSLVPGQFIEEMSGQELELGKKIDLFDACERFYPVALAKILMVKSKKFMPPRTIPYFFCNAKKVSSADFDFLKNADGVSIGNLRLGAQALNDVIINLPAKTLVSHHVLISAATGKGKSNFTKVFVSGLMDNDFISCIIFDPHGEYYGGKGFRGLSDLGSKNIEYFTSDWENNFSNNH